jgi:hypothetical protein
MFNSGRKAVEFEICESPEGKIWMLAVDTNLPSPDDICEAGKEKPLFFPDHYPIAAQSMVIFISKPRGV